MLFRPTKQTVLTYPLVNLAAGLIGLAIVWLATHSWLGLIGCFISALHFQIHLPNKK